MSATLCAELYSQYFGLKTPHIFVGARRFKNRVLFADDLAEGALRWNSKLTQKATQLVGGTRAGEMKNLSLQIELAVSVIVSVGRPESAVLIFVPGMAEILDLSEKLEAVSAGGKRAAAGQFVYRALPQVLRCSK